jgi:hypothetical protein
MAKKVLRLIGPLILVFALVAQCWASSTENSLVEVAKEGVETANDVQSVSVWSQSLESWWDSLFIKDANKEECIRNYLNIGENAQYHIYGGAAAYALTKVGKAMKVKLSPHLRFTWVIVQLLILSIEMFDVTYDSEDIANIAVAELNKYSAESKALAKEFADKFNDSVFIDESPFSFDGQVTSLRSELNRGDRSRIRRILGQHKISPYQMRKAIFSLYKSNRLCNGKNEVLSYREVAVRIAQEVD